jgi:hypothetical protein
MKELYRLVHEVLRKSWGADVGGHRFAGNLPETELQTLAERDLAQRYVVFRGDKFAVHSNAA